MRSITNDQVVERNVSNTAENSAGGGFIFGAVTGYVIAAVILKKVMKIAAGIIGLIVVGLSYLSYKGRIDVKWIEMENAAKVTLTNVAGQAVHAHSITICSTFNYTIIFGFTCGSCLWIHTRTNAWVQARIMVTVSEKAYE